MSEDEYISGEAHQAMSHKRPPKKVTISTNALLLVVLAMLLIGASFYAGTSYQKHHTKVASANGPTFATNRGFGLRGPHHGGDIGQVTAVSSSSITVSNQRTGTDKTYTIDANTTVLNNGQTGSVSDIKTGDTVIVEVSSTSSTTATRIVLNPAMSLNGADSGPSTTQLQ